MMKRSILAVAIFNAATAFAADNIPALKEVNLRPRLGRENVTMRVGGEVIRPADFTVRHSLNGKWKFKGLERQKESFGPASDLERQILSPKTDDKDWTTIDVPLNWWMDERFKYEKVFNKDELFFLGYYRRSVSVPDPSDGKRRFLRFEEIGAEAEIYVNGSLAGWHAGDFVPCEIEITRFLTPGDNLIGVRVLADLGPQKKDGVQIFTRPYGARWDNSSIKGGIWHDVSLVEVPSVRISEMYIDPAEDFASIRVRGSIDNVGPSGKFALTAALVEDVPGASAGEPSASTELRLSRGLNSFDITVPVKSAKTWTPDDPNLYWAAFALTDASDASISVVAASLERFGFRTMRTDGNRFLLNGSPIYLVGDSLHSVSFGGRRNEPVATNAKSSIAAYKANGVNTLRTAHMPAIPEVYECADEMGMLIYDEWANSFCNRIDEKEFERNNLPALRSFVRRDYNHASVVLWSLGNEVEHHAPEISRQLDRQYDLVKDMDGQSRPISTFSGSANVWNYGMDRLKTDFIDLHDYLGIDEVSWTEWFRRLDSRYPQIVSVFGEGGRLKMPLVMWECVGAGWCIRHDDAMKPGDVGRYLDWMRRWCSWGMADGIPFSAAVGLLPILDSSQGRHYAQGYLAVRLCEMFRQDRRFAGFAPWFADPSVPGCTRWAQQVYPLLRNNASPDGRLMFRQLFSPGGKDLECVVVNDTDRVLENVRMAVSLRTGEREIPLGGCSFSRVGVFDEGVRPFRLSIPSGLSGDGEVCLRLTGQGREESLNGYKVRLHSADEAVTKAADAHEVALVGDSSRVADILSRLSIPSRTIANGDQWPQGGRVIVPPGAKYDEFSARSFVDSGGLLLMLEPTKQLLSGFAPLFLAPGTNHLVEIVVPRHPVFNGLTHADLDTWAENAVGAPVTRMVGPLGEGVLACRPRYIQGANQYGMGLCEYAVGKGRLIVSSLNATRLWGENPAATRYLRNLLAYVAGGELVPGAPMLDDIVSRPVPQDICANPLVLLSRDDKPLRLSFAGVSVRKEDAPYKIFFFKDKLARLKTGNFRYLTLVFRSGRPDGMFDVTIPKEDHCNRLTFTVPTALSRGEAVVVRLDLKKDFRFAHGEPSAVFGLDSARGEIIFYNGYEQENLPPFPRPPLEVEITEMRFE